MNIKNFTTKVTSLRRFSLRSCLIAFVFICIGLGVLGNWVQALRRQGEAYDWLSTRTAFNNSLAGLAFVEFEVDGNDSANWRTRWVREWIHPSVNRPIKRISVSNEATYPSLSKYMQLCYSIEYVELKGSLRAETLVRVARTPGLKRLNLGGSLVPVSLDLDWSQLSNATSLERIDIGRNFHATPELAAQLSQMPKLKETVVTRCPFDDVAVKFDCPAITSVVLIDDNRDSLVLRNGRLFQSKATEATRLARLRRCFLELSTQTHLETLWLCSLTLEEPEILTEFSRHSTIRSLRFHEAMVSVECFEQFLKLPRLKELFVGFSPITDKHLEALAGAHQLERLFLSRGATQGTADAIAAICPNCKIARF